MGGTGNTGQDPLKEAALGMGGGTAAIPQWGAAAASPDVSSGVLAGTSAAESHVPILRPYEAMTASTGAGSATGPSTGLLAAAAPAGFQSAGYPTADAPVQTYAAEPPPPPAVAETPKEFAAPTSFANPWDAGIGATGILNKTGMFNNRDWDRNPEQVRMWLQAYADSGGDWRKVDKYYNPISPIGDMKIYWPGDPARPK